jgi:hypothetical protein
MGWMSLSPRSYILCVPDPYDDMIRHNVLAKDGCVGKSKCAKLSGRSQGDRFCGNSENTEAPAIQRRQIHHFVREASLVLLVVVDWIAAGHGCCGESDDSAGIT